MGSVAFHECIQSAVFETSPKRLKSVNHGPNNCSGATHLIEGRYIGGPFTQVEYTCDCWEFEHNAVQVCKLTAIIRACFSGVLGSLLLTDTLQRRQDVGSTPCSK